MSHPSSDTPHAESALTRLETCARRCDFLVIDNANFVTFAARLSGFAAGRDWAVLIAVFGFSEKELAFPVNVFGYGSVIPNGFALRQVAGLRFEKDAWDAESMWTPTLPINFRIGDKSFSVSSDLASEGLRMLATEFRDEVAFGHALTRELGYDVLVPRRLGPEVFPEVERLRLVVSLDDWDHPERPAAEGISKSADLMWLCDRLATREVVNGRPPVGHGLRARLLERSAL